MAESISLKFCRVCKYHKSATLFNNPANTDKIQGLCDYCDTYNINITKESILQCLHNSLIVSPNSIVTIENLKLYIDKLERQNEDKDRQIGNLIMQYNNLNNAYETMRTDYTYVSNLYETLRRNECNNICDKYLL
jgi:hypothetical protein